MKESDDPDFSDHDWSKADEMDIAAFYFGSGDSGDEDSPFGKITGLRYETHYYVNASVELDIEPEFDDFEYFSAARLVHSGDYQYINQVIHDAFEHVLYCRTSKGRKPKDGDVIYYIIGNAVVLNEDIEGSEDPWTSKLTMVIIPIKMWFEEE